LVLIDAIKIFSNHLCNWVVVPTGNLAICGTHSPRASIGLVERNDRRLADAGGSGPAWVYCLALGLCWAMQPEVVKTPFPGLNYAAALAWVAVAGVASITDSLRTTLSLGRITRYLAYALLIGTLLQSLAGFTQIIGLAPRLGGWVFSLDVGPSSTITGNIGQRNLYADYLMWGVVAAVYLVACGKIRLRCFVLFSTWLALSLACAASRSILLYVSALLIISSIWHVRIRDNESRRMLQAMALACALIVAAQFATPLIAQGLSLLAHMPNSLTSGLQRFLLESSLSTRRFPEWHKAWLTVVDHPLRGIGWGQFASQSVGMQALPQFADIGYNSELFTNAHNLVMQLLAEMGIPITALAFFGFIWVILPFWRQKAAIEGLLPLACLSVTLTHSLREYPLWYVYFLAMAIVFCTLSPAPAKKRSIRVSGLKISWRLAFLASMSLFAIFTIHAYAPYQALVTLNLPTTIAQQDEKRSAVLRNIVEHFPLYRFHALYTLENYMDTTPQSLLQQGPWLDQLAAFHPDPSILLKQAERQALLGQAQQAQQTMRLTLSYYPKYAPAMLPFLRNGPALWQPLYALCLAANARLPKELRGDSAAE
jgi:O-antigen ligase